LPSPRRGIMIHRRRTGSRPHRRESFQ